MNRSQYKFNALSPSKQFQPIVKNFFTIEFDNDGGIDYLLPNGLPSFFYIQSNNPLKAHFGRKRQYSPLSNGFYIGYCNTVFTLTHERAKVAGASIYPVYFKLIFGKSLAEIMNQFCEFPEPDMLMPVKSLMNTTDPSFSTVFEYFEKYIGRQVSNHPQIDDFEQVYKVITGPGGFGLRVEELAEKLGYSTRHLNSRFRQHFGMSPKLFIKMVKFNHALKCMDEMNPQRTLASIAHETGYHDQSHFIRDFKSLCGKTPKEILATPDSLAAKFRLFDKKSG
jgi:AraC-like DNA-binding protein